MSTVKMAEMIAKELKLANPIIQVHPNNSDCASIQSGNVIIELDRFLGTISSNTSNTSNMYMFDNQSSLQGALLGIKESLKMNSEVKSPEEVNKNPVEGVKQ